MGASNEPPDLWVTERCYREDLGEQSVPSLADLASRYDAVKVFVSYPFRSITWQGGQTNEAVVEIIADGQAVVWVDDRRGVVWLLEVPSAPLDDEWEDRWLRRGWEYLLPTERDDAALARHWASLTQRGGSQSDEAAELVRDLVAAVRTGMTLGAYSETAVQETTQHEVEASTKVEAALRAKTSANPVTVNASVGGARRALRKSGVVVTSSGAPVARFRSVRNGLIQLADMLELERIDILIDEWSLLDVSIQPIFANTLRQAFGSTGKVSVKIAGDRYNMTFSNGPHQGLELGADLFEAAHLDRVDQGEARRESRPWLESLRVVPSAVPYLQYIIAMYHLKKVHWFRAIVMSSQKKRAHF
jgi:hypothetical protein